MMAYENEISDSGDYHDYEIITFIIDNSCQGNFHLFISSNHFIFHGTFSFKYCFCDLIGCKNSVLVQIKMFKNGSRVQGDLCIPNPKFED
jgi:hypothetical protein